MRLEKFFKDMDVLKFFTIHNLEPTSNNAVDKKVVDCMRDKDPAPVFWATLNKVETKQTKHSMPIEYELNIHNEKKSDAIPMYYLTWKSNGMRTITIKENNNNPRFFITASMTGCSLTVGGGKYEPVISHLNAFTQLGSTKTKLSPKQKIGLTTEQITKREYDNRAKVITKTAQKTLPKNDTYKFTHSRGKAVHPSHYKGTYGNDKIVASEQFKKNVEGRLSSLSKINKKISYTDTRLTCFGIRGSDGWKFYMVKRRSGTVKTRNHFWQKFDVSNIFIPSPPVEIFPENQDLQFFSH